MVINGFTYKYPYIYISIDNFLMDKIIQVLKSWIDINLTELKTGRLPHVSFIINTILTHPTSRGLVKHLSGYEVVKIGYILFHMYEGKTLDEAKEIAENIHTVQVVEITEIDDEKEECPDCSGDGILECSTCYGNETIDCPECYGDPDSVEGGCNVCDETGKVECDECYGDGEIQCYECDGDGEVITGYDYVDFDDSIWFFTNEDLYKTYEAKIKGDIQNINFYEESDEHAGDLWLYRNMKDGMRLDDLSSVASFEKPEEGQSAVSYLSKDIPSSMKENMSIKKYGNSKRDYRII
jgi:hypothetical protein